MEALRDQDRLGRVALVTGASRGIGAEVAHQLAATDTHVIVNYREKGKRANAVVDDIVANGGCASVIGADLADEDACIAMVQRIATVFGRLDLLVLNASGGVELGADAGYPMRLNRDAQIRLTRLALPLMPPGGRIVFVTRAAQDALQTMQPRFDERGVHFVVVRGDMFDGTILARAIVAASIGPVPVDNTIYVGARNDLAQAGHAVFDTVSAPFRPVRRKVS